MLRNACLHHGVSTWNSTPAKPSAAGRVQWAIRLANTGATIRVCQVEQQFKPTNYIVACLPALWCDFDSICRKIRDTHEDRLDRITHHKYPVPLFACSPREISDYYR